MEETLPRMASTCASADAPDAPDDLVQRAIRGDVTAFETLYRLHVGHVYGLSLRLSGDTHSAEECTQETFVRAWQCLGRFRGEAAFGSWLYRIAVNVMLNRYRREVRRTLLLVSTDTEEMERVPGGNAPLGLALDLEQAILELPLAARMVFVLHEIEGYGHPEIASLMHCATGTSKAHLHRARRRLQARLRS